MTSFSLADLEKMLMPHLHLSKSRLETLRLLVPGMISARTVNLMPRDNQGETPTAKPLVRAVQHGNVDHRSG